MNENREKRDEAIDAVQKDHADWVTDAQTWALNHAMMNGTVTSDDVRDNCPLPEGADPRILGAVFRNGINRRLHKVGYTESRSPRAHARPIPVWSIRTVRLAEQYR